MWLTKKTWTSARNQADSPMTTFCPNHCTTAAFVKVTYDLHVANPMNRSQSSHDMTSRHHLNKVVHSLDPWNPRFWATVLSWFSSLLTGHSSSVSCAGSSPLHQHPNGAQALTSSSPPTLPLVSRFQILIVPSVSAPAWTSSQLQMRISNCLLYIST